MILSTQGGVRAPDGSPIALGLHTGHWEVGLLVQAAADALRECGCIPFAAFCTDPCDGRTQGTPGMFDSLPYRNDAALVMRRLARSLPTRSGVLGVATCDKGLPAMLLAVAGLRTEPGIIVPGGVTLPAPDSEDTGLVQTIGARFAHGLISLEHAQTMGCRACGSPGGGCQFLGTAATAQVVAEGLGLCLPHAALAPSGEPVWLDMARRSALALVALADAGLRTGDLLTEQALHNAMVVYAAFGGSTNLLLHLPAVAHAAGLPIPTVEDWARVNRSTPRLVDALPNGPVGHPTIRVFAAGGVPEVMLHLRRAGLLHTGARTVSGRTLGEVLDGWQDSPRRAAARAACTADGVPPEEVIMDPDRARARGLTSTVVFPVGNLAPDGSVIKATAIDPSVVDEAGIYTHRGAARVFTSEADAIAAIKGAPGVTPVKAHDIVVVMGIGPAGTGMEEIYQITSALKFLPWGKTVSVLTDARFSGVSTGACIGHIGPEALAGGPTRQAARRRPDRDRGGPRGPGGPGRYGRHGRSSAGRGRGRGTARTARRPPRPGRQSGAAGRHPPVGRPAGRQRRHLARRRIRCRPHHRRPAGAHRRHRPTAGLRSGSRRRRLAPRLSTPTPGQWTTPGGTSA